MISQAVILAAGRGKRMKNGDASLFDKMPKPLLEVNGVPIVERIIKKLANDYVDIGVVISPKERKLFEEKLGAYDVEYIYQRSSKGTADAVYCARGFVTDELFLVMMGDDITDYSVEILLNAGEPSVFGYRVEDVSGYGAIVADDDGMVEEIIEKQRSGRGIANTGVYIMPKEFFGIYKEIPKDEKTGEYFLTEAPRILAQHGIRFRLRKLDYWMGINTREQLRKADDVLRSGKL